MDVQESTVRTQLKVTWPLLLMDRPTPNFVNESAPNKVNTHEQSVMDDPSSVRADGRFLLKHHMVPCWPVANEPLRATS